MAKIAWIFIRRFLNDYIARQLNSDFLTDSLFELGVLATMIVPAGLYCAYGGPVSPWLLVITALTGVIAGLMKYIREVAPVQSIVNAESQDDES